MISCYGNQELKLDVVFSLRVLKLIVTHWSPMQPKIALSTGNWSPAGELQELHDNHKNFCF